MSLRRALRAPVARRALRLAKPSLLLGGLLLAALLLATPPARAQFWFGKKPMPEFTNRSPQAWINSKPISRADLHGKVVLIEVWTSG